MASLANVHDYLLWRGDLTLDERPFNDVDNLVLALLSYLDFTGIVPGERSGGDIELVQACRQLVRRGGGDVKPFVRSVAKIDTRLVELVAGSRRFGAARLHGYTDMVDEERSLQFAALQVDLPTMRTYVSFRGTDSTLVGWREDFMLSFCVTEAQREAAGYLERALERAEGLDRMVYVGGHSKGGNLAEYAAVCCPAGLRSRISRVYSNDGPGVAPEFVGSDACVLLDSQLRRIVPSYSIVGMLFAREGERRTIVESTGTGIGQHDPTTWGVTRSGFREASGLHPRSVAVSRALTEWARGIPLEERERLVDEVFDALEAGGATRFDEILSSREGFGQVMKALLDTDDRTQSLAKSLVDATITSAREAERRQRETTLDQWRKGALELAGDMLRHLQEGKPDMSGGSAEKR